LLISLLLFIPGLMVVFVQTLAISPFIYTLF
jgi:hypothetical protein